MGSQHVTDSYRQCFIASLAQCSAVALVPMAVQPRQIIYCLCLVPGFQSDEVTALCWPVMAGSCQPSGSYTYPSTLALVRRVLGRHVSRLQSVWQLLQHAVLRLRCVLATRLVQVWQFEQLQLGPPKTRVTLPNQLLCASGDHGTNGNAAV